ncbi:MAG: hypothetical protein IV100_34495 [Myxococcales bacterium]|nr:hypothetical protein [Myxococcales bacterium]
MTSLLRRLSTLLAALVLAGCHGDMVAASLDTVASADAPPDPQEDAASPRAEIPDVPEPPRRFPTLPGPRCDGDESNPDAPCPGECRGGVCFIACGAESPVLPKVYGANVLTSYTCNHDDARVIERGLAGHAIVYELQGEPTLRLVRRDLDTGGTSSVDSPVLGGTYALIGIEVARDGAWLGLSTLGRVFFMDDDGEVRLEVDGFGTLFDVAAVDERRALLLSRTGPGRDVLSLVTIDDRSTVKLSSSAPYSGMLSTYGMVTHDWLVIGDSRGVGSVVGLDALSSPRPLALASWTPLLGRTLFQRFEPAATERAFRVENRLNAGGPAFFSRIVLSSFDPLHGLESTDSTLVAMMSSYQPTCTPGYDDCAPTAGAAYGVLADRGLVLVGARGYARVQPDVEFPVDHGEWCPQAGERRGRHCVLDCDVAALTAIDAALEAGARGATVLCSNLSTPGLRLLAGPAHVALALTPVTGVGSVSPPGDPYVERWLDARATREEPPMLRVSDAEAEGNWNLWGDEFSSVLVVSDQEDRLVTRVGAYVQESWGCQGLTHSTRLPDGRHVVAADRCLNLDGPGIFLLGVGPSLPRILSSSVFDVERLVPGPGYVVVEHERYGQRRHLALPVDDPEASPTDVLLTSPLAGITLDGRYVTLTVLPDGRRTVRLATPTWQGDQVVVQGGETLATAVTLRSATASQVAREIVLGFDEGVAFLTY